jgi:hypothetical protein
MAEAIQLEHKWTLGSQIGKGGLGRVLEATSESGQPAALKLVRNEPGAERELLFVDLTGVRNVVPIIDSGETTDAWVLVMPRADKSLREHLASVGSALMPDQAIPILMPTTRPSGGAMRGQLRQRMFTRLGLWRMRFWWGAGRSRARNTASNI